MGGKSAAAKPHASVPLPSCQALLRRPLLPVRSRECADDPAPRADHARAKGRYRHVVSEAIHIQYSVVVAEIADDPEPADALRPHVGERNRKAVVALRRHTPRLPSGHAKDTSSVYRVRAIDHQAIGHIGRRIEAHVLGVGKVRPRQESLANS